MKRILYIGLGVLAVAAVAWAVGQYGEDEPHVSGVFGNLILGVRKDTQASLCGTDGDYTSPEFNAVGALWTTPGAITFESAATPTYADTTTLATVTLGGQAQYLAFEVQAYGTLSFYSFMVRARNHASGQWYDYVGDTDFDSTTNSNMLFASATGPHELICGSGAAVVTVYAHAQIRVNGVASVALPGAVSNSGSLTSVVRGIASH